MAAFLAAILFSRDTASHLSVPFSAKIFPAQSHRAACQLFAEAHMFEDALLESAKHSPGTQRTVSTAASLLLQTGFLAMFVIVPLLATRAVPDFVPLPAPIWLPHLENPAPEPVPTASSGGSDVFVVSQTMAPP